MMNYTGLAECLHRYLREETKRNDSICTFVANNLSNELFSVICSFN